jgi:hypothetical protein
VNDPTVFRRDRFKPNCATTLFNQRDSAVAGLFLGASGADITVACFEELALGELSSFGSEVVVVNPDGRVVVSSSPDFCAGERMRAPSQESVPVGGPGVNWRIHRL